MTQAQFAQLTGLSERTISQVESTNRASQETLKIIAEKLGIPPDRLIKAKRIIKITGDIDKMTDDEMRQSLREISEQADMAGEVSVMKKEHGCVKLTVEMSLEDAKKLDAAFQSGKLSGVLEVSEVPKWWHKFATQRAVHHAAAGLGIACSLAMLLPVWAPPFYVTGIALSLAAAALVHKPKWRLILPMSGVVLNVAGLVMWPRAIGFYKGNDGYEFRDGDRSKPAAQAEVEFTIKRDVYFLRKADVGAKAPNRKALNKGDVIQILVDGKVIMKREVTDEDLESPEGLLLAFAKPEGTHSIVAMLNDEQLYSGNVDFNAVGKSLFLQRDDNGGVSLEMKN